MTISMYQASAPRFANTLKNLSAILDKAQAHAEAKKIDPLVLTGARLYPDMFALARQVQIACDTAKGAVARLAGVEIPKHEDTEKTFEELKARIAKTRRLHRDGQAGADRRHGGQGDRAQARRQRSAVQGHAVPARLRLPNFYFHVTTAYDILRHNGVELGKRDFIGNPYRPGGCRRPASPRRQYPVTQPGQLAPGACVKGRMHPNGGKP